MTTETQSNEVSTETTTAPAASAGPLFYISMQGDALRAFPNHDGGGMALLRTELGADAIVISSEAELAETNDVPLASMVKGYNKVTTGKKTQGFKTRVEAAKAVYEVLTGAMQKVADAANQTDEQKLTAAVKPAKPAKAKKEKAEGTGEGRSSPLSGKFWSRSGNAIKGRRLGGSGVGIQALQYIINNPGTSTEDYLKNSGGGRFVDLAYDLDNGNIVALTGATPEERTAEIATLAEARKGAEKAEAEKQEKAEADKKAKLEKQEADKKAKQEKAAADKKAKDDAKVAADKAAADAAAKAAEPAAPAAEPAAPAAEGQTA